MLDLISNIISPFPKEVYQRNAKLYKLLANPVRLEILNIIKDKEATVDELSEVIGIKKANTSQHLAILRYMRVVKTRKNGQRIFYRIANKQIVAPCHILRSLWSDKAFGIDDK